MDRVQALESRFQSLEIVRNVEILFRRICDSAIRIEGARSWVGSYDLDLCIVPTRP